MHAGIQEACEEAQRLAELHGSQGAEDAMAGGTGTVPQHAPHALGAAGMNHAMAACVLAEAPTRQRGPAQPWRWRYLPITAEFRTRRQYLCDREGRVLLRVGAATLGFRVRLGYLCNAAMHSGVA